MTIFSLARLTTGVSCRGQSASQTSRDHPRSAETVCYGARTRQHTPPRRPANVQAGRLRRLPANTPADPATCKSVSLDSRFCPTLCSPLPIVFSNCVRCNMHRVLCWQSIDAKKQALSVRVSLLQRVLYVKKLKFLKIFCIDRIQTRNPMIL